MSKTTCKKQNPFARKRRDHDKETGEDYVELVAELIEQKGEARTVDLAQRLGVTSVTVSKTLTRLREAGLIRSEPYRSIFLTEAGKQLAMAVKERHEIVRMFLEAVGVPPDIAEEDSEGMEHHISETTLDCMRQFLRCR